MPTHSGDGRDPFGIAPVAASHPSSGTGVLRAYVPRLQAEWLAERPHETWQALDGSIAFVDVSGFTKLSERLAKQGKVGAEDLADAIGACFSSLLGVAYGNGGGLLKFGGDALLLWFSGAEHEVRATRAAIGMRRTLRDVGRIEAGGGRVTLRMSVGVHSGMFHHFLVGGTHRELIVTGPAASTTVSMESTAEAGEILVSRATAAALPPSTLGDPKGAGRLLRRSPPGLSAAAVVDGAPPDVELAIGVPEAVRTCLLGGLDEPEHKQVTIAFVHFDGTDDLIERHGPVITAGRLDELVRVTQDAVSRHGVCFLASDIDHDGGKLILAAGAPTSAGNDEERMLCALRDIVDARTSIPVRIGVNRGHVFAGDIGPSYRRTYTVMGDAVNLAARLMAKAAPGEILATADVLDRSRAPFESTALEPFLVKGKARPVHAFSVGGVRHDDRPASGERDLVPLVGRDGELEVLLRALRTVHEGRGRLVEVVGEAGIGKSRLIEELVARAADDTAVLRLACGLYEASTPYFPFRRVLRDLLDLAPGTEPRVAGERLVEVVAERAPDLAPWLPLLAIVVDADVAPTPECDALDERFRREHLEVATTTLLGRLLDGPTLIVVEDGHWMDEPSAHLLGRLASRLEDGPWLVCVSRRDTDAGFVAPDGPLVTTLHLQPLEPFAATVLADAVTEDAPLAPHDVAILAERAGGNPLFLRELVAAAAEAGGIDALPDSVEAVVTARIDRLAPPDRSLLRRLAVLGSTFERSLAAATFIDELRAGDAAWHRLADFVTDDGPMVRFRHALVRDAAYEGLPFRVRQRIHAQVGDTLARESGADDSRVALLSLHFFCARRFDDAWGHSVAAARQAVAAYANVEAAQLYERAVESARRTTAVPDDELADVHEALGDVRNRLGEYGQASAAYRSARRLRSGDAVATARLLRKHSRVSLVSDRTVDSLRWLGRADRALTGATGADADRERAQIAVNMAAVRRGQGRCTEAVALCERAIADAKAAGDLDALAHAYFLLDASWVALGRFDRATHSSDALALYEELGDHNGQGVVLNNMGTQAYWQGRWDDAVGLYDRGRLAREKVGDAVNASYGTVNVAEILSDQGRLDEARPLLQQVLRVWRAAGDRGGVAYALGHLARVAYRSGRFDEAHAMLDEAEAEAAAIGSDLDVIELAGRRAESHLLAGDAAAALATLDAAVVAARSTDGAAVHLPPLLRLRASALEGRGAHDDAHLAIDEAIAAARSVESDYEIALALRLRSRLTGSVEDAEASEHVLTRLGIVRVFDPPWAAPLESAAS